MRWKAIERFQDAAWVAWRRGRQSRHEHLSDQAWEALCDYLGASGRMPHIQPDDYIFTALKYPGRPLFGRADEWLVDSPLSALQLRINLNQYLAWAELALDRLTLKDLRHTAVMLRHRAGATPEEIHAWLGTTGLKKIETYLQILSAKTVSPERLEAAKRVWQKGPYARQPPGCEPGRQARLSHGYYAVQLPEGELQAAKDQPFSLEDAIARFRVILGRVFDQAGQVHSLDELVRLMDLSGKALSRLVDLENKQRQLAEQQWHDLIERALLEVTEQMRADGRMKA